MLKDIKVMKFSRDQLKLNLEQSLKYFVIEGYKKRELGLFLLGQFSEDIIELNCNFNI